MVCHTQRHYYDDQCLRPMFQSLQSLERQFVLYANHDRHVAPNEERFRPRPYDGRCPKLNRRRANATELFIHEVLTGKVNSPMLRDRIIFFDGSRAL